MEDIVLSYGALHRACETAGILYALLNSTSYDWVIDHLLTVNTWTAPADSRACSLTYVRVSLGRRGHMHRHTPPTHTYVRTHAHAHTPCRQHCHKLRIAVERGVDVDLDPLVHDHSVGVGLQEGSQLLLDQLQWVKELKPPLFKQLYEWVGAPMNSWGERIGRDCWHTTESARLPEGSLVKAPEQLLLGCVWVMVNMTRCFTHWHLYDGMANCTQSTMWVWQRMDGTTRVV